MPPSTSPPLRDGRGKWPSIVHLPHHVDAGHVQDGQVGVPEVSSPMAALRSWGGITTLRRMMRKHAANPVIATRVVSLSFPLRPGRMTAPDLKIA